MADDPHRGRRHTEFRARDAERPHPPHHQPVQNTGHAKETGQKNEFLMLTLYNVNNNEVKLWRLCSTCETRTVSVLWIVADADEGL